MKGRKPTPIDMKLLNGNAGHRRPKTATGNNPVEPVSDEPFTADVPEKPAWLTQDAAEEWDRLVEHLSPVLSGAAAGMLVVACSAFAEMREGERIIQTEGRFYETVNKQGMTMKRPHPASQLVATARNAYHKALTELGASPVSHSRVKKLPTSNQTELPGINRFFTR